MPGVNLEDYIPVAERVAKFVEKYPEGSLQTTIHSLTESRVVMVARAYRNPTDERPGIGWSSLEIPGRTPYTRGSEIENCETSAWGRAIAALGIETRRGIATAEEVANKSGGTETRQHTGPPTAPEVGRDGMTAGTWRGTVKIVGALNQDMSLREQPDGSNICGFRLVVPKDGEYVVIAQGDLALALFDFGEDGLLAIPALGNGEGITVAGRLELRPWEKDGRAIPPAKIIHAARITTDKWTVPKENAA